MLARWGEGEGARGPSNTTATPSSCSGWPSDPACVPRRYGEERVLLDELVSLEVPLGWPDEESLEARPDLLCQPPRAFMAAQVAAGSTPPCAPQAPLALLAELEPSLKTTVSIALIRIPWRRWCIRPESPAAGPV
jgi:hypothetical protein